MLKVIVTINLTFPNGGKKMKPIEEKDREMLRKELEHFFKNWGFDVPGYEGNEKGETFFCIGNRKCPAGFNDDGDFIVHLINTFKDDYLEYIEGINFSCNSARKPGKVLIPQIAFIYKQPEIQFLYIKGTKKYHKGDVSLETNCRCGGVTSTATLEYLPYSSEIPEFQAYMEQYIGG